MRFNLAIDYKVKGRRIGSERIQTATAFTVQEFEIKEIEAHDAPIVLEWMSDPTHYDEQLENVFIDAPPSRCVRHVRKMGEQFYTPMQISPHYGVYSGPDVQSPELTSDLFRRLTDTHCYTSWLGVAPTTATFRNREERIGRDEKGLYEHVLHSTLESRTNAIKAAATNLVVINDIIYRKCIEPEIRFLPVTSWISQHEWERAHIMDVRVGTFYWANKELTNNLRTKQPERFWIEDVEQALAHLTVLNDECSPATAKRALAVSSEIFAGSNLEDGIYRTDNRCERSLMRAAKYMAISLGETPALSLGDDKFAALKLLTAALQTNDEDLKLEKISAAYDILEKDGSTLLGLTAKIGSLLDDMPVRMGTESKSANLRT